MAQTLDEQLSTVERSLGECMIEHALVVVRSWLNELGENNPYEEAYAAIRSGYRELFAQWLNIDDPKADEQLNRLTGDAYQLVDAVHAAIRLHRGLSPEMHGFNPEHPQSVMNYFANSVRLRPEDLEWLHEAMEDPNRTGAALMAANALTKSLRDCFNVDAFLALVEGIHIENELLADQNIANVFTLLIHYDIRIDYFPQIQDAVTNAIAAMDDDGDHAFDVLCAMVRSVQAQWTEKLAMGEAVINKLADKLRSLLEGTGIPNEEEMGSMMAWIPKSEQEYMTGLMQILPQTWLYEVLVLGNEERERRLTVDMLGIGNRELMWRQPDAAEAYFVDCLRRGSVNPSDYINYAHCLLLKGDRMMAFENYRQARQLCKTSKDFYALFRPDRRVLADHGIPLEQIYLLEDQLLKGDA